MKFIGEKEYCDVLENHLKKFANENFAFSEIYNMLQQSKLEVYIGNEQDLINDSHNKSKTLTEFRCYNLGNRIYLFNTMYETTNSLIYNLVHEICHMLIRFHPLTIWLAYSLNGDLLKRKGKDVDLSKPFWLEDGYEELIKYDDTHNELPEEKICNWFAQSITSSYYDRYWWRDNIEKVDKSA